MTGRVLLDDEAVHAFARLLSRRLRGGSRRLRVIAFRGVFAQALVAILSGLAAVARPRGSFGGGPAASASVKAAGASAAA
jgi:hypothetical protein